MKLSLLEQGVAFSMIHVNGSGAITLPGFVDWQEKEIKARLQIHAIVTKLTDSVGDRAGLDELTQVFAQFDVDNTGDITATEFAAAFAGRGLSLTEEEVENVFPLFDTDGSGT